MLGMAVKGTKFCPHSFVVLSFPWTCRLLQNKIGKKCTVNHDIWGWAEIVPVLWLYTCNPNCIHTTQSSCKGLMVSSPQHLPKRKWEKAFSLSLTFLLLLQLFYQAQLLIDVLTQRQTHTHTHTDTHMHRCLCSHTFPFTKASIQLQQTTLRSFVNYHYRSLLYSAILCLQTDLLSSLHVIPNELLSIAYFEYPPKWYT